MPAAIDLYNRIFGYEHLICGSDIVQLAAIDTFQDSLARFSYPKEAGLALGGKTFSPFVMLEVSLLSMYIHFRDLSLIYVYMLDLSYLCIHVRDLSLSFINCKLSLTSAQVHYNNPELKSGIVDSSGIK